MHGGKVVKRDPDLGRTGQVMLSGLQKYKDEYAYCAPKSDHQELARSARVIAD